MRRSTYLIGDLLLAAALVLTVTRSAEPCTRVSPVSPEEVVQGADAIVRAIAVEYAVPPKDPDLWTTGLPDSPVRFRVIEVVKGKVESDELIQQGYVTDRDDFNELEVPYIFVRRGGRAGSCIANSYRKGAEFLLMLKRDSAGKLTPYWYALGPTNEQLRSADDPWLLWVRQEVERLRAPF
jgi:hypothetical protein